MESASKNQPESAAEALPCCGNRKRRCLHPLAPSSLSPSSSLAPSSLSPSSSPTRKRRCLHPPAPGCLRTLSPSSFPTRLTGSAAASTLPPPRLSPLPPPPPAWFWSASLRPLAHALAAPALPLPPLPLFLLWPFGHTVDLAFPPNLESTAKAFRFAPLTVAPLVSHPSPDEVPPISPPSFFVPARAVQFQRKHSLGG